MVDQPLNRVRTRPGVRTRHVDNALRGLRIDNRCLAWAVVGQQRKSYLKLRPINPIPMLPATRRLNFSGIFVPAGNNAGRCRPQVFHYIVFKRN